MIYSKLHTHPVIAIVCNKTETMLQVKNEGLIHSYVSCLFGCNIGIIYQGPASPGCPHLCGQKLSFQEMQLLSVVVVVT